MTLLTRRDIVLMLALGLLIGQGQTVLAQNINPINITIRITSDFRFDPAEITLVVGQPVNITLANDSSVDQSLRIVLPEGEYDLLFDVPPGSSDTLPVFTPETAGELYFFSPLEDYRTRYNLEGRGHVIQAAATGTSTPTASVTPTGIQTAGTPTPTRTRTVTGTPTQVIISPVLPTLARPAAVTTPVARSSQRLPSTGGPLAPALGVLVGIGGLGGLFLALGHLLRSRDA